MLSRDDYNTLFNCAALTTFALLVANPGHADEIDICIKVQTAYVDSSTQHDYWTNVTPTFRKFRGGRITVERVGGGVLIDDYLGNSADNRYWGCTGPLTVPSGFHTYNIKIRAKGRINGNTVRVRFEGDPTVNQHNWTQLLNSVPTGSGIRQYLSVSPGDETFNVAMAALMSINNDYASLQGEGLDIWIQDPFGDDCPATFPSENIQIPSSCFQGSESGYSQLYLSPPHYANKFVIAHEMGHAVAFFTGAASCMGASYNGEGPLCNSISSHSPASKEYQGAAIGEGWAHFYAADTWNDHDENDCHFKYYGVPLEDINCEGALPTDPYPQQYHFTKCLPPYDGWGAEVDWMRLFWDVHTDPPGHKSLSHITDWISSVECNYTNGYEKLDEAADDFSSIDCCWDTAKCRNGVNDPSAGCTICPNSCQ